MPYQQLLPFPLTTARRYGSLSFFACFLPLTRRPTAFLLFLPQFLAWFEMVRWVLFAGFGLNSLPGLGMLSCVLFIGFSFRGTMLASCLAPAGLNPVCRRFVEFVLAMLVRCDLEFLIPPQRLFCVHVVMREFFCSCLLSRPCWKEK